MEKVYDANLLRGGGMRAWTLGNPGANPCNIVPNRIMAPDRFLECEGLPVAGPGSISLRVSLPLCPNETSQDGFGLRLLRK